MSIVIDKKSRTCRLKFSHKDTYPFSSNIIVPIPSPPTQRKLTLEDWCSKYNDSISTILRYTMKYIDQYSGLGENQKLFYDEHGLCNALTSYLYDTSSSIKKGYTMLK